MNQETTLHQAIELIRLKVESSNVTHFLEGRKKVDEFVSTIEGHRGTEIVQVNDTEWLMMIRWESKEAVLAAQKITEQASVISDWINSTAQFVSFETSIVKYSSK
jgi:antibiotic biosynthesis monooxygenase (ABM) superfamily enzyme